MNKDLICPNCNLKLKYKNNTYKCLNCNEIFNFLEHQELFKCNHCNSIFLSNYEFNKCIKCGCDISRFENTKLNYNFTNVIPFKITKNKVNKIIDKEYKKLLLPSYKIIDLKAIYVPVYLFEYEVLGNLSIDCIKSNSWKSDGNIYEKQDVYEIDKKISTKIKNICISSIFSINQNIINSFNYNRIENINFKINNIIDISNIGDIEIKRRAEELTNQNIEKVIDDNIKDFKIKKIKNKVIDKDIKDLKCILIPIWLLKVKYKNENHNVYINGQNGYLYNELKISKNKIITIFIILFILIFFIIFMLGEII